MLLIKKYGCFCGNQKYLYLCSPIIRLNVYDEEINGYYSIYAMCGLGNGSV